MGMIFYKYIDVSGVLRPYPVKDVAYPPLNLQMPLTGKAELITIPKQE